MGILSGIKVVELAETEATQIAGMMLADWGADVVASPRPVLLPDPANPRSLVWNRNKRLVERDERANSDLIASADVFLGDEGAGQIADGESAGLACVVSPTRLFGEPAQATTDAVQAFVGFMRTHNFPGDPTRPVYHVAPASAYGTGLLAVLGTLAALYGQRTGLPRQRVEVSAVAGAVAMLRYSMALPVDKPTAGVLANDNDPYMITTPLIRFHRTKDDRWVLVGAPTESIWVKLCVALGRADLLADADFAGAPFGIKTREARLRLTSELAKTFAEWNRDELVDHLNAQGVIAAQSLSPSEFLANESVRSQGLAVTVPTPGAGNVDQVGQTVRFSAHPSQRIQPGEQVAVADLGGRDARRGTGHAAHSTAAGGAADEPYLPLAGIEVIEFGNFVAAPQAATYLATLGAHVIKVEPHGGDPLRQVGYSFSVVNGSKDVKNFDLLGSADRAVVDDLVKGADIVVHNFSPRLQEMSGIGWDRISRLNPRAIVASVNGWAIDGPLADRRSIDGAFQSLTGACIGQGGDVEPRGFYGGLVDNATSLALAAACIAALIDRLETGRGQQVATTLLGVAALIQSHRLVGWEGHGPATGCLGADPVGVSQLARLYQASDGWVFVDLRPPAARAAIAKELDIVADSIPDAECEPAVSSGRAAKALSTWIAGLPMQEVIDWVRQAGGAAAPANHIGELPGTPGIVESGLLAIVDTDAWGPLWHPGRLITFKDEVPAPIARG